MKKDKKKKASKKEEVKKITFKEALQIQLWVMKFNIRVSKWSAIVGIITEVYQALEPFIKSLYYAVVIDKLIALQNTGQDISNMLPYLEGYFLLLTLSSVINRVGNFANTHSNMYSSREIRRYMYKKLFELGTETIERPKVKGLLQTTEKEIERVRQAIRDFLRGFSQVIRLVTSAAIVYSISPSIFIGMLIAIIPTAIVQVYFNRKDWQHYKELQEELRISNRFRSFLSNFKFLHENSINDVLKTFDNRYWEPQKKYITGWLEILKKWNLIEFFLGLISTFIIISGYYLLFQRLLNGEVSIGELGFFTSSLWSFSTSADYASWLISNLQQVSLKLREVKQFFELKSETIPGTKSIVIYKKAPKIEIKNLSYKYPRAKETVLHNINMTIKPGEKIAIVGHNGAGKTTLIKLIARLYNVDKDKILINGIDLMQIKFKDWYKNLGVLFQDYNFYSTLTAGENISIGRPNQKVNNKKVIEAAKMADAHDFIQEYDKKYDTLMDESFKGGIRPSTGQQQKIAIARFFYRNAPVVIFDEPTAAIDAVAEYKIFNKIYEFFKGKTVIIISHRFSTVRNADTIYVMDKGKVIEKGNHEELLAKDGKYAEAFKLQAEGYQVADKNKDGIVDADELVEAAQNSQK